MKKIFFSIFLLLVISSFYYCGNLIFEFVSKIKLSKVDIKGDIYYQSPEQIYGIISQYKDKSFYGLNLEEIKFDLLRLPWIKQVFLNRKWPSKLIIELKERKPFAIYSDEGVISDDGEIFYPSVMPTNKKFPVFYGDSKLLSEMISLYDTISTSLEPIKYSIKELELMPDQGWRVLVNNGINLHLGSKEIEDKLKRFVVAYHRKLKNDVEKISYVDLRYTNGMAVKWK